MSAQPIVRMLVEGSDDAHFLKHWALEALGYKLELKQHIHPCNGIDDLVRQAGVVLAESFSAAGFVCDADTNPTEVWTKLREALLEDGARVLPERPESSGVVIPLGRRKIGVWLMPDNESGGNLESFLTEVRSREEVQTALWTRAAVAVEEIPKEQRLFARKDLPKAALRTWLAWQKEPGSAYGVAVRIGCVDFDHSLARRFSDWLRRLLLPDDVPGEAAGPEE